MKQDWQRKTCGALVVFMAAGWIVSAQLRAESTSPQKGGSTVKPVAHKASAHRSRQGTTHHAATRRVSSKRKRSTAVRSRRVQLHPEPERIQQIQQALVQAHYLNEEPNGRWDDQTREAMRRYQADHGFPETGLPEAKSLMKLGLGPHPLASELDTGSASAPSPDSASVTPAAPDPQQEPPAGQPQP